MNAIASYNTEVHGWKALVLENEQLRVTTLPGYGGWIYSIIYKPLDTEMLWHSSRGVIHRDDAPVVSDPLQQYKARSPGAWPEIFPHGSSAVKVGGVTIPFHGEVVSRAWRCEILESQGERVSARLTVDCHLMPLRLERTMILESGSPVLRIEETVTNLCGQKVDFMWGHHPIFGKPLLGEGSRIHAPAGCTLGGDYSPGGWPDRDGRDMSLAPQENSGISDMFYLSKLSAGWGPVTCR